MFGATVFVSSARQDEDWARALADGLEREGLAVFVRERDILPGDVELARIEEVIGSAGTALLVLSAATTTDPRMTDVYAAFLREAGRRGLRLIPVLYGAAGIEVPPLAGSRLWADFRDLSGSAYRGKVSHLASVIRDGEPSGTAAGDGDRAARPEALAAARAAVSPHAPQAPPDPTFVVTYARDDAGYGQRLVDWLTRAGLPAWSIADLVWGSRYIEEIRQRLRTALAVIVLMSRAAEESEDVEREVLEGQRHDREFFPVLLNGDRNFLLASSWYFDARDGSLPGARELRRLRRIHQARTAGRRPVLSAPQVRPLARRIPLPGGATLPRIRSFLLEKEFAHADLLSTSLLLDAVGRLERGWLRPADGRRLPHSLLADLAAVWSEGTGAAQGFGAQRQLYRLRSDHGADFSALALAYGWREPSAGEPSYGEITAVPRYGEFVDRAPGRSGFFPTLRNPQVERYPAWYDRWRKTVVAVHLRLRMGPGPP